MRRFILIGSVFSLLSTFAHAPIFAETTQRIQAQKIDLAGRQRMLSQRLAKAACFIATFSDVERHRQILLQTADLLKVSHDALKNGRSQEGILPESNKAIREELDKLDHVLEMLDFGARLLGESAALPGLGVDLIAQYNLEALGQFERVVKVMEMEYASSQQIASGQARALNIAGRQRMLIQKAAKEFCLITYGVDVDKNRASLAKTVHTFDTAIEDLRSGNPRQGISAVPTLEIRNELSQMKVDWQSPRGVLLAVASGFQARTSDFEKIAKSNEALLHGANQVIQMLVEYYKDAAAPQE